MSFAFLGNGSLFHFLSIQTPKLNANLHLFVCCCFFLCWNIETNNAFSYESWKSFIDTFENLRGKKLSPKMQTCFGMLSLPLNSQASFFYLLFRIALNITVQNRWVSKSLTWKREKKNKTKFRVNKNDWIEFNIFERYWIFIITKIGTNFFLLFSNEQALGMENHRNRILMFDSVVVYMCMCVECVGCTGK